MEERLEMDEAAVVLVAHQMKTMMVAFFAARVMFDPCARTSFSERGKKMLSKLHVHCIAQSARYESLLPLWLPTAAGSTISRSCTYYSTK